MQGMERAKAIRDLLSMGTGKMLGVADKMALRDAVESVSRGELPVAAMVDSRWQDQVRDRVEAAGAKFRQYMGGHSEATFEFSKPIRATAIADVPRDTRWNSEVVLRIGDNKIILDNFWRWDVPPEAIKRKLELVLAELCQFGAENDAKKAAVDLTLATPNVDGEGLGAVLRGFAPRYIENSSVYNKINKIPRQWRGERWTDTQYSLKEAERQLAAVEALQAVSKVEGWDYKGFVKKKKEQLKALIAELTVAVDAENEAARWAVWDKHAQRDRETSTLVENSKATYTDSPTAKKIAEYRSKLTGHLTLDNLSDVSDIAMDEAMTAAHDMMFECDRLTDGAMRAKERHEAIKRFKRLIKKAKERGENAHDLIQQHNKLVEDNDNWRLVESKALREACAARMLEFVSSIRPLTSRGAENIASEVFSAANPNAAMVSLAVRGLMAYPSDMVEAVLPKKLRLSHATRASYCESSGRMELSAENDISVPIHEFGHALERRCPIIRALESQFFKKRTAGQKPEKLRKLTGDDYGNNEIAIADHFLHPYMGKLYSDAFELVSVGFEMFYTEPWNLAKDEEYFKFILGIILAVTP